MLWHVLWKFHITMCWHFFEYRSSCYVRAWGNWLLVVCRCISSSYGRYNLDNYGGYFMSNMRSQYTGCFMGFSSMLHGQLNIACVFPVGGIDKVIDDIYSDPSIFTRLSCPIPATSDLCLCTWRHPRGRHGWKWGHPFFISSSSRTYYICELRLSMTYWLNRNVKTLKSVQLILQLRAPRYMWFWTVIWYIYTSGPI